MQDDPFKKQPQPPTAELKTAEVVTADKLPGAWQPFTPKGVATFAVAPPASVIFLKVVVALVATITIVWFVNANYFPSISEAIRNLPDNTLLKNRELTHVPSGILTQKKFLSVVVDLESPGETGQTADLQIELRKNYFQICSLFGCGLFDYPPQTIPVGRASSEPWWDARRPVILAMVGIATFALLWLTWIILALLYMPAAKLTAYFSDRALSWTESWRLSSAALMPGALLAILTIIFYGLQIFDLIQFLVFFALHFVVTWVYIFAAPFALPKISSLKKNPFDLG